MTETERPGHDPGIDDGGSIQDLLERMRDAVERTREVIATTRETLARPIDGSGDTAADGD
jgi:hypothetical protein